MNDFLINMGITTVLTLLKGIAKSDADKRKWRNAMLKIYRAIGATWPEDEAFKSE